MNPVNKTIQKPKNAHTSYRRVARPKRPVAHIRNKYQNKVNGGVFTLNMYNDVNPIYVGWLYARSIIIRSIPVILLHMMLGIIAFVDKLVSDQPLNDNSGMFLVFLYALTTMWGIRHAKDLMAHYNTHVLVSKHNINRKTIQWLQRGLDEANQDEYRTIEKFRRRYNKYLLFPTVRELATEEQLYRREINSERDHVVQNAITRRQRLSIAYRELEHRAAKSVADWKQTTRGGSNEYDNMVRRYKHRTTPEIRNIIERVQKGID